MKDKGRAKNVAFLLGDRKSIAFFRGGKRSSDGIENWILRTTFNNLYKDLICIMFMRLKALILLSVFLFNFVSVMGGSSTEADFNIGGCTFDFEGGTVGVAVGECSKGDASGHFYCDDDKYA